MNISIRECAAGEVTRPALPGGDLRYQCLPCGPGTYSFNPEGPNGTQKQCTSCTLADHSYCDGAAKVPYLGFWHSHPRSDQVSRIVVIWFAGLQVFLASFLLASLVEVDITYK
jgi:hypothetical protein